MNTCDKFDFTVFCYQKCYYKMLLKVLPIPFRKYYLILGLAYQSASNY